MGETATQVKDKKTDYTNDGQQNLMRIAEYLAADVFKPTTIKDIAAAMSLSESKARWTLHNMAIRGWVEQVADGWRLSPRLVKIADSVRANLGDVVTRYLKEGNGNGKDINSK
ncbi:MAG: hypothetical protein HY265_06320 [Deltaproteobacteria bacterium]|nr:hypothetical protein [Deltaproteobacteria bacterium]